MIHLETFSLRILLLCTAIKRGRVIQYLVTFKVNIKHKTGIIYFPAWSLKYSENTRRLPCNTSSTPQPYVFCPLSISFFFLPFCDLSNSHLIITFLRKSFHPSRMRPSGWCQSPSNTVLLSCLPLNHDHSEGDSHDMFTTIFSPGSSMASSIEQVLRNFFMSMVK